jgi:toxin HigB-1
MIRTAVLTANARRDVRRLPRHVVVKLLSWVEAVESSGLEVVRKIPGFHDEPLRGQREGQRSIRLSRAYRAIYRIVRERIEFVSVLEVSKHDY